MKILKQSCGLKRLVISVLLPIVGLMILLSANIVYGNFSEIGAPSGGPIALEVTATETTLTFGEMAQLMVIATFDDGSTEDLTAASTGTVYRSIESASASVDENGMVTAIAPGDAHFSPIFDPLDFTLCHLFADLYWAAVRFRADSIYIEAQSMGCDCCGK